MTSQHVGFSRIFTWNPQRVPDLPRWNFGGKAACVPTRLTWMVAVALVVAAPAVAQAEARYTKSEKEVQATQTTITKPQAPPPLKKETGPPIPVDQFLQANQNHTPNPADHKM